MTTLSYTRNGQSFAISPKDANAAQKAFADLALAYGLSSGETFEYLAQYGWTQSLQDSIAGREKKVRDEFAAKWTEWKNANPDAVDDDVDMAWEKHRDEMELAVMADLEGQLGKRQDAIVNNTISVRGVGEQRDPLKAVAQDMVRKAAASKGLKIAKELLVTKANELLETKREIVQAEYNRRKETAIEIDLD